MPASLTKSSTVAKTSLAPSSRVVATAMGERPGMRTMFAWALHILLPALRCNVKVSVSHGQKTY